MRHAKEFSHSEEKEKGTTPSMIAKLKLHQQLTFTWKHLALSSSWCSVQSQAISRV